MSTPEVEVAADDCLQLLTYKDLERLGFGHQVTVWRHVRSQTFPAPLIVLGKPRWRRGDIAELIADAERKRAAGLTCDTDEAAK